ncbi:MAG TPA: hypothetical protein VN036_00545 [Devosia sp.]|nr:hypothetical protein [Devosia sp.]
MQTTSVGATETQTRPVILGRDFAALEWTGITKTHQTSHPGRGVHYEIILTPGESAAWEVFVWDGAATGQRIACFPWEGTVEALDAMLAKARNIANQDWQRRAQTLPPSYQDRVYEWVLSCFGEEIARDIVERNHRFLEEALELVQSLGCSQSEAHQLVDYVYHRPAGEPFQEAGGTQVTLAALLHAAGITMAEAGEIELTRVWLKADAIRAKQAAKPKHSPLPEGSGALDPSRLPEPEALVGYHGGQTMPAMFHYAIEGQSLAEIAKGHGFEVRFQDMLGSGPDDAANEALEAAYEADADKALADWHPTFDGEGWIYAGKWHDEDGPTSCFLRKKEIAA